MRKAPEKYRIKTGQLSSDESFGNNGMFVIPHDKVSHYKYVVQISDGKGWEHASISLIKEEYGLVKRSKGQVVRNVKTITVERCPTWEEMCFIKDLFWSDEECVLQYHPEKKDYVSMHPYCLHLWKPIGVEFPKPDSLMVGVNL